MVDCRNVPQCLARYDVSGPPDIGAAPEQSRQARGIVLCTLSALSFSVLPFLANAAYGAGVDLAELLLIRFLFAATVLWLIVAVRRPARPRSRHVVLGLALGGGCYAVQSALYFAALPYNGPSLTTLLLYTFPAVVFVVSLGRNRDTASAAQVLALVLALGGVTAVLLGAGEGTLQPLGVMLGLATALAYSTYILIGDAVDPAVDRTLLGALVCSGALVTYAVVNLASGGPTLSFDPAGWWWAGSLGLLSTAFALTAFFAGMRLVGASRASIVSCVEPVATVLIGVSLFDDRLGAVQLVGAVGVVAAVVLLQWRSPIRDPQIGGQGSAGHSPEGSG
jgi:drug/metabolite transporter (DMT)-like permease